MGICASNLTDTDDNEESFHASYASADGLVDYALQDTPLHSLLRTELIDVIKVKEILTNTPSSALFATVRTVRVNRA